MKLALVIEYDGSRYRGFQIQRSGATIQGELERAIATIAGQSIRVIGAGRTDAGVHAMFQVVSFLEPATRLEPADWLRALNYYLPEDIAVLRVCRVGDEFDARRTAVSRTYRYRIVNRPVRSPLRRGQAGHASQPLDVPAMDIASRALIGEHDFVAFAASGWAGRVTVRQVYRAEVSRQGDEVVFEIEASGFLLHQVRLIVGTLMQVGTSKLAPADIERILVERDREATGPAAPPAGLCLTAVRYPPAYGIG